MNNAANFKTALLEYPRSVRSLCSLQIDVDSKPDLRELLLRLVWIKRSKQSQK